MSGPTHPRERRGGAVTAQEKSTVCPKCGGALDFRVDSMGYGQTLEQCTNPRCDYWCTLEKIVRPAHTKAPSGDFGRSRQIYAGPRTATRDRMIAVRAALPSDPNAAETAEELSAVLGLTVCQVKTVLGHLEATGQAARRNRLRPIGALGRPPVAWWAP